MIKSYHDSQKSNGYWLSIINQYQNLGIDQYSDYLKTLEALTPQDICNYMKEFNKSGNHITVAMLPEE